MGEADSRMSQEESLAIAFSGLKKHFGSQRQSTELTVLEILRKSHPDFFVTSVSHHTCDLLGYANAGLATAKMDSLEAVDINRTYVPSRSRLESKSGELKDHVRFGRWDYTWQDSEFLVYEVEFKDHARPCRLVFVLAPHGSGTKSIHHQGIDALILAVGEWTTELHDEIYVFDNGMWQKNKELWKSVQGASWDEVILNPAMKNNLMKDVHSFFDNRALYKKLSVPWKRGLILHGVPGNGKTISIKALINELYQREQSVPSLYVKAFDSCNGKKNSIRAIFSQARTMAPCFLIFEDLDSVVEEKERSYFLNEVDGLESNDGILMVGSTNHLDKLDPAISKRPSRFDRKYHFKLPGTEERILYCKFWRQKVLGSGMVEFPEEMCRVVGEMTDGFSFAYLKELFVIALLSIARGATGAGEEEQVEEAKKSVAPPSEGEEKKEDDTLKRVVPEVKVPAELKDNLLLKVLIAEITTLVDEMDNTEEDDMPSERKKVGASSGTGRKALRP